MPSFSDTDKDHLFALLERQTKLLLMLVENIGAGLYLTKVQYDEIKEIKEYLNR